MKASRFTEAQKAFILKQREEGTSVAGICRKAGIGQSTCFAWKKTYGGLLPDEMRRVWAMGKKLRILTIVDTHSRYRPATDVRFQYRGEDVVQTLERICSKVGYPKPIRVENGSDFISRGLDVWACAKGVTLTFSWPGKPTDNGFIEAFNSKLRSECRRCRSDQWRGNGNVMSLADAAEKLEVWRSPYTDDRPHSAIGDNVPSALHFPGGVTNPPP